MDNICTNGTCELRSVSGLLASLLTLAKEWHTEQVRNGKLTDEGWERHYSIYIAERLTPYLTSLQSHSHNTVSIPLTTPEERDSEDQSYESRIAIPKPSDVGAESRGRVINSRFHVGE